MSEPTSFKEYEELYHNNLYITGFGPANVTNHYPCPFCAAPEWSVSKVIHTEEDMVQEHTCKECGRSGKFVFTIYQPNHKAFEFVQTGGDDPPSWLVPAPRRI